MLLILMIVLFHVLQLISSVCVCTHHAIIRIGGGDVLELMLHDDVYFLFIVVVINLV